MINLTDQMIYRLGNLNTEQQRISHQMSTGKLLDRGSDDSSVFARDLYVNDKIRTYEGLQNQVSKTTAQNDVSDSSIAEVKNLLDFTKTEIMKGLNAGMDASDKEAAAISLEGVKENLLTLANERVDGEYLFAGSNTTIKPFSKDETTGEVTYNGDALNRKIAIKPNTYRDRGVTGLDTFFYNKDAGTNINSVVDPLKFTQIERVLDQDGSEWHLSEATAGSKLTFNIDDTIQQRNVETAVVGAIGNTWALSEAKAGHTLTFDANDTITDDLGNAWTVNTGALTLTSGSNTIAITASAGDIYTATVPDTIGISKLSTSTTLSLREINTNNMTGTTTIAVTNVEGDQYETAEVTSAMESLTTTGAGTVTLRHFNNFGTVISADDKNIANIDTVASKAALDSMTGLYIREYTLSDIDATESFEAKHSIFDDLDIVINALNTDTNDTSALGTGNVGLRESLELITNSYDAANVAHSTLGGRNRIFEIAAEEITTRLTHFNILSQEVGAADLSKVAMEAKALEMTYTALYSTITKMNNLSLVNFIR